MLAPLRYVISIHKRTRLTILAIAVVIMFLTSVTAIIYSFELSNKQLVERFESKYYIVASTEHLPDSRVPMELVGDKGAYVSLLRVKIGNISTYLAGIYDPNHILGKRYECGGNEIILGKSFAPKNDTVLVYWDNGSAWMSVRRIINLDIFPSYWAVANLSFVNSITHHINFIIVKEKMPVGDYKIYSMTRLNEFYQKNVEEITWDLLFIELIAIVVIYVFNNALLNMEIRENVRKIGIIKAVGSTRKNIAGIYLLRSLFIGFAGMILGFSMGVILAYLMTSFIPLIGLSTYFFIYIPPVVFLIDVLISVLGSFLASIGPIRRAVQIDIIRGMREAGI